MKEFKIEFPRVLFLDKEWIVCNPWEDSEQVSLKREVKPNLWAHTYANREELRLRQDSVQQAPKTEED